MVTRKRQHIRQHHKIVDKQAAKEAAKTFSKLASTNTKQPAPSKAVCGQPKFKKTRVLPKKPSSCNPPFARPLSSRRESFANQQKRRD